MYKILIVEDDELLLSNLLEQLRARTPYIFSSAMNIASARELIAVDIFDLLIIDVGLPDGNGMDFCKELRENDVSIPIVMLTSHSSDVDIVSGLELGANDYITKPFRLNVVIARLETQLRQHSENVNRTYRFGDYQLDYQRGIVTREGQNRRVALTPKENALLRQLINSRGQEVSKSRLMKDVWNYQSDIDSNTVQAHIYRLRSKLKTLQGEKNLIHSNQKGYYLIVENE